MWDCLDCPSSPSFIPSFFTSDSRKRRLVLSLLSAEDPDTGSDTRHTSRTLLHTTTENNEVKGGGKKNCALLHKKRRNGIRTERLIRPFSIFLILSSAADSGWVMREE
jgi:hypothetical protein